MLCVCFFACNVSAQLVQAYRVGGYGPSDTAMTGNICVCPYVYSTNACVCLCV